MTTKTILHRIAQSAWRKDGPEVAVAYVRDGRCEFSLEYECVTLRLIVHVNGVKAFGADIWQGWTAGELRANGFREIGPADVYVDDMGNEWQRDGDVFFCGAWAMAAGDVEVIGEGR